jgi:uncharacterized membrane protein YfcA
MLFQALLAILSGSMVGLLLGATGGGGSLIAIPLLVYVVGVPVQKATALSLVVVGYSALFGAWQAHRIGKVRGLAAVLFSGTGMIGAWLGAHGQHLVTGEIVLFLFGLLLCGISIWTILRGRAGTPHNVDEGCAKEFSLGCASKALVIGLGVGLLTGFFGVGGGFLIVPALLFVMGFPMKMAVGTSLLIIALISIGGIIGHLEKVQIDYLLAALIIGGSLVGMIVGTRIGKTTDEQFIQKVFAYLAGGTGLFLLVDNAIRVLG